ncbi:receptor-like protein kinase [Trifolium medium]|uniref:Receptor-like protein kinase n=1 Tax=Trifolium medium TaxID=97028 RepID=A0A392NI87_9FABA|nr:receptor-like protein kinase [Trifolium medium]
MIMKAMPCYNLRKALPSRSLPLGIISLIHSKCHDDESHALFQFKEGFTIKKSASWNHLGYPKTAFWNTSTDCCSWDGIKCDEHTDHVIHIDLSSSQLYGTMDANSSLFRLVHLRVLNLADNDFNYSQIPSKIGELSKQQYRCFNSFKNNQFVAT